MNKFNRFILVLLSFSIMLFIIDRISFNLIFNFFLNSKSSLSYAYQDETEEIVILGSSRAKHYNTDIIREHFGDSLYIYSYGSSGQNIYYHYALLNVLLQNKKPKIVICDIMDIDVKKTSDLYSTTKLSELYPLYSVNDTIKSIVNLQGIKKKYALKLSKLYHFNSKIPNYVSDFFIKKNKYQPYIGLVGSNVTSLPRGQDSYEFDEFKINYIQRLINICEKNEIKLILVVSPIFELYEEFKSPIYDALVNLDYGPNSEFWYYEQDTSFIYKNNLFYDRLHLNSGGVSEFTKIICNRLTDK